MQTFLPYASFTASLKCLDNKREANQRNEAKTIFRIVTGINPQSRWRNHPAVKMWDGYIWAIAHYMNLSIQEWINRGKNNNMVMHPLDVYVCKYPPWLGDEEFHASHRSNLLRKDPDHYGWFDWQESDNLPYLWPVFDNSEKGYHLETKGKR